MTRPTKIELMTAVARLVATRSTCKRAQVGAIVTDVDMTTIVSMGYNGPAHGQPNDACTNEVGRCGCVHAEVNALVKAPYRPGELRLFTTTSPCHMCASLITNAGIAYVVMDRAYRDTSSLAIMESALVNLEWASLAL